MISARWFRLALPRWAFVLTALCASVAMTARRCIAQTTGDTTRVGTLAEQAARYTVDAGTDPTLLSSGRLSGTQAVLVGSADKKVAAAEFTLRPGDSAETFLMSIKVAGPVAKNSGPTVLGTLDGLTDHVTFTAGLRWLSADVKKRIFASTPAQFHEALWAAYQLYPARAGVNEDDVANVDIRPEGRRQIMQGLGLSRGIGLFSVEYSRAAPTTFKFVDPDSLTAQKESHGGDAVTLSAGWMPLRWGLYYLGATYRYEQRYASNPMVELCTPIGPVGSLRCGDQSVGAPKEKTRSVGQVEVRHYFPGSDIGINPRLSRDFENKVTAFEVPVYFIRNAQGVLNGGLSLGWREAGEDEATGAWSVAFFIGALSNPLGN